MVAPRFCDLVINLIWVAHRALIRAAVRVAEVLIHASMTRAGYDFLVFPKEKRSLFGPVDIPPMSQAKNFSRVYRTNGLFFYSARAVNPSHLRQRRLGGPARDEIVANAYSGVDPGPSSGFRRISLGVVPVPGLTALRFRCARGTN